MTKLHGFTKKELLETFRIMATARKLDEKMLIMLKQGKSYFQIGCSGHEAAQLAAATALRPGSDWLYPYYRDAALCLGMGMSAQEQLLCFLGRVDDPNSGGRQFPQHYGNKSLRIVSQSSVTGTQFLQAVGTAMVCQRENTKDIVYVSSGEGTTSQGDFHEALNWSSRIKASVIFHIEDNDYAISVHKSEQTSGGSVYSMTAGYQNLARYDVDGTDYFETYLAFKQAVERARKGKGPSVIISHVIRLLPHSSSDDQRKYRPAEEFTDMAMKDPLVRFQTYCMEKGIATQAEFDKLLHEVAGQIDEYSQWAENQAHPDSMTATDHIYSGETISVETVPKFTESKIVIIDAINHALSEEMQNNGRMVIYGEDVADPKGGVFTATKGLGRFGKERVFNSPLAESSIIGTAIGMAVAGWKPVVEIQFCDYIWTAMMQIRNELVMMRYRSNNQWSCPVVIRVPVGGYIHGGPYHSQSIDGYFMHMPGIYIAYPSTAADAKGLLKAACRMNDPVLFLEHKGLYRQGYCASFEPDDTYILPFGNARQVNEGNDLTVITWGAMVQKSIEAMNELNLQNEIDLIDLRTLNPLDKKSIRSSIEKTGKVLIVQEDNLTNGPGSEIAAWISADLFEILDGPIKRVAAKDCPIPYNWYLEEQILPQTTDIVLAMKELLEY